MSKPISPRYINSPSTRRAPHAVESIIGFLIIVAVILAILVAAAGWFALGGLIMAGALFTYLAVGVARAAEVLTDRCPNGTEHEPVVETEEHVSEFWGAVGKTVKITVTCANCGQPCRPRYEEEDEACTN